MKGHFFESNMLSWCLGLSMLLHHLSPGLESAVVSYGFGLCCLQRQQNRSLALFALAWSITVHGVAHPAMFTAQGHFCIAGDTSSRISRVHQKFQSEVTPQAGKCPGFCCSPSHMSKSTNHQARNALHDPDTCSVHNLRHLCPQLFDSPGS